MAWILVVALVGCVPTSEDYLKSFDDTGLDTPTGTAGTATGAPTGGGATGTGGTGTATGSTPVDEDCSNGIDDDGDGRPDCFDTDCERICDADGDGEDGIAFGGDDCNDDDPEINPDALERCNDIDDDCDGLTDDSDPDLLPSEKLDWYADLDGDGFGDPDGGVRQRCAEPPDASLDDLDCDDTRDYVNPSALEVCNHPEEPLDDDCDGLIDDDDPDVLPDSFLDWYADMDGDGFGSGDEFVQGCEAPPDSAPTNDDCDDSDPTIGPPSLWYPDADRDEFGAGAPVEPVPTCEPPGPGLRPDWVGLDCDDGEPTIHPGAEEICEDGIDQDCDGVDIPCITFMGEFLVDDGPEWLDYPPTYSCAEACAELFGGDAVNYRCSVDASMDPDTITGTAWLSEYGSADHCQSGAGGPLLDTDKFCVNYDMSGCQSAYVRDNCGDGSTNYCWIEGAID